MKTEVITVHHERRKARTDFLFGKNSAFKPRIVEHKSRKKVKHPKKELTKLMTE